MDPRLSWTLLALGIVVALALVVLLAGGGDGGVTHNRPALGRRG